MAGQLRQIGLRLVENKVEGKKDGSYRFCVSGEDGAPARRSRSLSTRQISEPSSSYFSGSVSFMICRKSSPKRAFRSARGSGMEHPNESDGRDYISTSAGTQ